MYFFPDTAFYEFITEKDMMRNYEDPSYIPCRYIYTGSSKTDRCVRCLADNADGGSCDNFHCNLPVSDIRKAFHEGKIGILEIVLQDKAASIMEAGTNVQK